MHTLIEKFINNKEKYCYVYLLNYINNTGKNRENTIGVKWENTSIAKEIEKTITELNINRTPFKDMFHHVEEFTLEEIDILIENMPSGWERAKIMEYKENTKDYIKKEYYERCPACNGERRVDANKTTWNNNIYYCSICDATFGYVENRKIWETIVIPIWASEKEMKDTSNPTKYFDFTWKENDKVESIHGWYSIKTRKIVQIG